MGVNAADPGLDSWVAAVQGEVLAQDEVELVGVGLVADEAVLEERKRRAVGGRELAEQVIAPGEQPLEELERPGQLPPELRRSGCESGSALARSASISFGGRFQIRLNQSRKTSSSARRASSRGKSGGSGCSSSR